MAKTSQAFRFQWEQRLRESDLPAKARHIGHLMATYASADGANIFPGNKLLAKGAGLSVRTVSSAVGELRAGGWITRTQAGNSRMRQSDVYRLSLPSGVTAPATSATHSSAGANAARTGAIASGSGEGAARSSARNDTPPDQVPHQAPHQTPEQINRPSSSMRDEPNPTDIWARVAAEQEEAERANEERRRLMDDVPSFDD